MTLDPQTEPEHVKLAREWLDPKYSTLIGHHSTDILARAVLDQHAQIAELKRGLTLALDMWDPEVVDDDATEIVRLRKLVADE